MHSINHRQGIVIEEL